MVYVYEGDGMLNIHRLTSHNLIVLGGVDKGLNFKAGDSVTRLVIISGQPINEPIVQYGPFVMNARDDIEKPFVIFNLTTLSVLGPGLRVINEKAEYE